MMVVPSRTRSASICHRCAATARVEPGGRLVEEQDVGTTHQTGGDIEPPTHAAGVRLHQRSREVGEIELFEQLVSLAGAPRTCDMPWSRPIVCEVEPAAHQAVDGGLLRRNSDSVAHAALWCTTSRPATVALPSVGWLSVVRMRMAVVLPAPL